MEGSAGAGRRQPHWIRCSTLLLPLLQQGGGQQGGSQGC